MPKPFMLGVEVEEIALGKIMRVLNGMPGVVKLHMDLSPKKRAFSNGKAGLPRKSFTKSGERVVLELLAKAPMQRSLVGNHFADLGRSSNSINSCLHKLKIAKQISLDAKNQWHITAKGRATLKD